MTTTVYILFYNHILMYFLLLRIKYIEDFIYLFSAYNLRSCSPPVKTYAACKWWSLVVVDLD